MAHTDLSTLLKNWIPEDRKANALWEVKESTETDSVTVRGTLKVTIENCEPYVLACHCDTQNDDDSIGRALQALNEKLLNQIQ